MTHIRCLVGFGSLNDPELNLWEPAVRFSKDCPATKCSRTRPLSWRNSKSPLTI